MNNHEYDTMFDAMIEDLQGGGAESVTKTISTLMNVAMKIDRRRLCEPDTTFVGYGATDELRYVETAYSKVDIIEILYFRCQK